MFEEQSQPQKPLPSWILLVAALIIELIVSSIREKGNIEGTLGGAILPSFFILFAFIVADRRFKYWPTLFAALVFLIIYFI